MAKIFIPLFFVVFLNQNIYAHPVHVSVMNVVIDTLEKEVVVSIKFYKDDLNRALNHNTTVPVVINDTLSAHTRDILKTYLKKNIKIQYRHKNIFMADRIDCAMEDDFYWVHIRFHSEGLFDKIMIHNTLLMDIYHDQTNLVIISQGTEEHGLLFNNFNHEQEVIFDNADNT